MLEWRIEYVRLEKTNKEQFDNTKVNECVSNVLLLEKESIHDKISIAFIKDNFIEVRGDYDIVDNHYVKIIIRI